MRIEYQLLLLLLMFEARKRRANANAIHFGGISINEKWHSIVTANSGFILHLNQNSYRYAYTTDTQIHIFVCIYEMKSIPLAKLSNYSLSPQQKNDFIFFLPYFALFRICKKLKKTQLFRNKQRKKKEQRQMKRKKYVRMKPI